MKVQVKKTKNKKKQTIPKKELNETELGQLSESLNIEQST